MRARGLYAVIIAAALAAALGVATLAPGGRERLLRLTTEDNMTVARHYLHKLHGGYSLQERVDQFAPAARVRLAAAFARAGLIYPPQAVTFVVFKDTRLLEIYGRSAADAPWVYVKTVPVLGMSGVLGPKLRAGDEQVPEGIYAAEFLNPNSRYHVAIRVSYPNALDRARGAAEGRQQLGGDIMIHGTSLSIGLSIGCVAVGNETAEDLFVLAALVGKEHVRILISPTDFRIHAFESVPTSAPWVRDLYVQLYTALRRDLSGTGRARPVVSTMVRSM